ncbi:MAG: alkaline phosphatase family protein [Gordonia sp. (in: high G+C Gram-positive bacteria)]|uniref:alkaline phosphatase family protein n=1 Tax=Gordonia sp. (in: high G+C Gram-positive bacteria) TaxID=84139 RepID=UPI0039E6C920
MGPLDAVPPDRWTSGPTLADLTPSAASALGFGDTRALPVPDGHTVVMLLVDGLGDLLLGDHAALAPTLSAHRVRAMCAGFPSTTAASLTALGTGLGSGEHGILGYSFVPRDLDPDARHVLNALRWTLDTADGPSAARLFPAADVQPAPSMFDELARAGVDVVAVMPGEFAGTGLTLAAYGTPADHRKASSADEVRRTLLDLVGEGDRGPRLVYAYLSELDTAGHLRGPGSPEWCERLRAVDGVVRDVVEALPPGAALVVTGDHGMIGAGRRIDVESDPALHREVRALAGEARVRQVYAEPGAGARVARRWADVLGDDARVATRDQVIDERWFGPGPAAHVVDRIGDVVVVARGDVLLTRPSAEPFETTMPGHHGGWTAAEMLVPLIVAAGEAS